MTSAAEENRSYDTPPPGWREGAASWRRQVHQARRQHRRAGAGGFGAPREPAVVADHRPGLRILWDVTYLPEPREIRIANPDVPYEHHGRIWRFFHRRAYWLGWRRLDVSGGRFDCVDVLLDALALADAAAQHPTADVEVHMAGAAVEQMLWVLADFPAHDADADLAVRQMRDRAVALIRQLRPLAAEALRYNATLTAEAGLGARQQARLTVERERQNSEIEAALAFADSVLGDMNQPGQLGSGAG